MEDTERRLERRLLCADLVRIVWRPENSPADAGGSGVVMESDGVLEDISHAGACVQLEAPLPVGARVRLIRGESSLKGVVSHCVFQDYGYFAGIQLAEDTHWSSGVFMPRHLTNPRALG